MGWKGEAGGRGDLKILVLMNRCTSAISHKAIKINNHLNAADGL